MCWLLMVLKIERISRERRCNRRESSWSFVRRNGDGKINSFPSIYASIDFNRTTVDNWASCSAALAKLDFQVTSRFRKRYFISIYFRRCLKAVAARAHKAHKQAFAILRQIIGGDSTLDRENVYKEFVAFLIETRADKLRFSFALWKLVFKCWLRNEKGNFWDCLDLTGLKDDHDWKSLWPYTLFCTQTLSAALLPIPMKSSSFRLKSSLYKATVSI